MLRTRSVAVCAALVATATAMSSRAAAQATPAAATPTAPTPPGSGVELRLRSLHGFTHDTLGGVATDDWWYAITPEILAVHVEKRWTARASYSLTGGLHQTYPDEIAHNATAGVSGELSKRTTGNLGVQAAYSTVSNYLVTAPANLTPLAAVPLTRIHVFSGGASEGVSYEASPVLRLEQRADGSYYVVEQVPKNLQSTFGNFALAAERYWKNDSVGLEGRAGVASTKNATLVVNNQTLNMDQTVMPITVAPRWRHDWSRTVSSLATAGGTYIVSLGDKMPSALAPYGRASLLYDWETAHVEASYGYGVDPNFLTGQLLEAHAVTLTGTTPLSIPEKVALNTTLGYLRGSYLNLRKDIPDTPDFSAVRADVEVVWGLRPNLQVLGRYQFLWQTGQATTGVDAALFHHAFIAGIQLLSAAPTVSAALSRAPQRVDRRDAIP